MIIKKKKTHISGLAEFKPVLVKVSCISFLALSQALRSMPLSNPGWGRGSPTNNQFKNVAMRNPPLIAHACLTWNLC